MRGRIITLKPAVRLALDDADAALWRVAEGIVDLYVELDSGGGVLQREYLFSVDQDEILFSFPASSKVRVVASGRLGAKLEQVDRDAWVWFRDAGAGGTADLIRRIEPWIVRLSAVLASFAPSIDFVDEILRPDQELRLEPQRRAAGSGKLLWACWNEGDVVLLDGLEYQVAPGEGPGFLPLTSKTWISCREPQLLRGITTAELEEDGLLLTGIAHFQTIAARMLGDDLEAAHLREQKRLAQKSNLQARDREAVLQRFSALFTGRRGPEIDGAVTPLQTVFHRLGEELGVDVETEELSRMKGRSVNDQVEAVCRRSRLRARRVILRGDWWHQETGAMLAFYRDSGAPLALLPGKQRWPRLPKWMPFYSPVSVWDVAAGGVDDTKPVDEIIADQIAPVAWSFYRGLPVRRLGGKDLLRFAVSLAKRDLLLVVLCAMAGTLMGMVLPFATAVLFDVAIPSSDVEQLRLLAIGLLVAALAAFCFKICESVAVLRVEGRMLGKLQPALIDRLLRLPNTFFRDYSAGDLAERAQALDQIQTRLTSGVLSTFLTGVFSILNFLVMFWIDVRAASVALLMLLVILAVMIVVGVRQRRPTRAVQQLTGEISSMTVQVISGMRRIRLAGAEDRMFIRWGQIATRLREAVLEAYVRDAAFTAFVRGAYVFSFAVLFYTMSRLGAGGDGLSTGAFLAFLSAFTITFTGVVQLAPILFSLVDLIPLLERLGPILHTAPETSTKAHPGTLSGRIEVNDVVFRYGEGMPNVLDGMNIKVEAGESIAVVGRSGCGKSTLFRLILGFEQPTAGSIYFDGKDLAGLDLREVRHQIGVVLQQDELMEASIFDNIRGVNDIALEDAWHAARMCGLASDIEAMPMGMHTVISAHGADLSGGQVQKLLIARALASRPRILLLDEATSALDNRSQAIVTESLDRLRVTRLAIAHRLSTVQNADRIFVIDRGRVVEQGTFEELIELEGFFAELVRRQLT